MKLPFVINPKKGYISSSNQRVGSDRMHIPFASNMGPMSRAVTQSTAIAGYIQEGKKITTEMMKALQNNIFDSLAQDALPLMLGLLPQFTCPLLVSAVEQLRTWNFQSELDSVGASIFYAWEA